MLLIFGILLVLIFGYLLSAILVEKMNLLERIGISYLLGFGIFTLLMFCYSTLGLRITLQSTIATLIGGILLMTAVLIVFKRKISINLSGFVKSVFGLSKLEKITVLAIATIIVASLIITTYFPVYIWDALALYDFRAKIIMQTGFYTQIAKNHFWFGGYPLFTSLSHTLVYIFGGGNPQFLYSLMYLSYILVFYGALREIVNRKITLITTLMLATIPVLFDHSTFAYTNLPYSIFLSMGSIYLYVWFVKKKPIGYLIISALMTGLSTWTRSTEPFWMVNILLLVAITIYGFKKYFLSLAGYIFSFLLIKEPWGFVNYYLTNPGVKKAPLVVSEAASYTSALFHTALDPVRIMEVVIFIYKNVITSWYPLIFLFLFCFVINIKPLFKRASSLFLIIIFLYFGLLLYATYVYSFGITYWYTIPDSARRMAMFFIPLMVFYIGLTFQSVILKSKSLLFRKNKK